MLNHVRLELRPLIPMLRALSLFAMAGGFLVISPSLRGTVMHGFADVVNTLNAYSPYSYVFLGLALLFSLLSSIRAPKPQ